MNPAMNERFKAVLIFIAAILVRWALQERSSMTDCDAEAYIQGARSLAHGLGYVSAARIPMNHWPAGYSLLLSLWSDPIRAAFIVNLVSHGLATVLLWAVARREGWSEGHSLALAAIASFGFFAGLTRPAKPDILTYAFFLAGVLVYRRDTFAARAGACLLFCALIPVKMIAITFAPGFLLAEMFGMGFKPFLARRWRESLLAGVFWTAILGGILWYNAHTLKEATPSSYEAASLETFTREVMRFITDFFRCGLATWYGTIRPLPYLVTFAITAGLGLACLLTLRRSAGGRLVFRAGVAMLILSFGLECYRTYFAGPRLMGYGMLLTLVGMAPRRGSLPLWGAYAAALLCQSIYGSRAVTENGLNCAAYEQAAVEAAGHLPRDARIFTNGRALLDVHVGIASELGGDLAKVPAGSWYWRLDLPNYDAIMVNVYPPAVLDDAWKLQTRLTDGAIYQKVR